MDKKSGIYYDITDSSIRVGGASTFGGIVLMYTTKGEVGKLNTVTARDYRDILGYDVKFNPNYVGLDKMLSSVSSLEVFRLNKDPSIAYKIWGSNGVAYPVSVDPHFSAMSVEDAAGNDSVFVACKSPGTWGNDIYVAFSVSDVDDEYKLHYYTVSNGTVVLKSTYVFSIDDEAPNYYKNIDFGDLVFGYKGDFPVSSSAFFVDPTEGLPQSSTYNLYPGSNGSELNDATDVQRLFYAIDKSPANVVVTNGLFDTPIADKAIIQAILEYCGTRDRTVILDAPLLIDPDTGVLSAGKDAGVALFEWADSLRSTVYGHYASICAVPDQVKVSNMDVLIQPSVYMFQIYARMFHDYGNINYPPAGPTYGLVSVNKLMDNDFYLYGDALKTHRINYLTSTSQGVCMWEYRTLYTSGDSDLSYATTTFILRDLKGQLMSFMDQFTFRYSTPVDLLTIRSGLSTILDRFKNNYFLVNYTLYVPTYEEAQAAGRELHIDIEVAVINSADVITLRVNLRNAADLRAA